mmetsp:Transcript_1391/g.2498  ORF Transcript_1391/g.2498 Transcript_1391/m.2498 type:complete len:321 (-) Transcript_1391:30-992(-)
MSLEQSSIPPPPPFTSVHPSSHPSCPLYLSRSPTSRILVVLCGWYGSSPRHLSRFATLHKALRDVHVLALTLPSALIFGTPTSSPEDSSRWQLSVLESVHTVASSSLAYDDVTWHVFSNGGCLLLRHLYTPASLLSSRPALREMKARTTHCVMDSAPCLPTLSAAALALTLGSGLAEKEGGAVELLLVRPLLAVGVTLRSVYLRVSEALRGYEPCEGGYGSQELGGEATYFWQGMRNGLAGEGAKECFIYSDADPLCPVEPLERLVEERRGDGRDVKAVKFQGTGHVLHFMERPEEYEKAMREFFGVTGPTTVPTLRSKL